MTKSEIYKKENLGKWVRTAWSDTGARDGVIVEISERFSTVKSQIEKDLKVFFPDSKEVEYVDDFQVVAIGVNAFHPCFSGLDGMNELKKHLDNPFYM